MIYQYIYTCMYPLIQHDIPHQLSNSVIILSENAALRCEVGLSPEQEATAAAATALWAAKSAGLSHQENRWNRFFWPIEYISMDWDRYMILTIYIYLYVHMYIYTYTYT